MIRRGVALDAAILDRVWEKKEVLYRAMSSQGDS